MIPEQIKNLDRVFSYLGFKTYLVGGTAIDLIRGHKPNDWDLEVFEAEPNLFLTTVEGIDPEAEVRDFTGTGSLHFRYQGLSIDATVPRTETLRGGGEKHFLMSWMGYGASIEEAASRRHYTVGSIYLQPDGEMIDPFGGFGDYCDGILKATSPKFKEDPIRVIIGMRYADTYNLNRFDDGTIRMARNMIGRAHTIHPSHMWEEWSKFLYRAKHPSVGMAWLSRTWLNLYPQIRNLSKTPQDSDHHPEGNIRIHTDACMNEMVASQMNIAKSHNVPLTNLDRTVGMLAALCHDFGKAATTAIGADGRLHAYGHEKVSMPLAVNFMNSIGAPDRVQERVVRLIEAHMRPIPEGGRQVMRWCTILHPAKFATWAALKIADRAAKDLTSVLDYGIIDRSLDMAQQKKVLNGFDPRMIHNGKPKGVLTGQDCIDLGWTPGKHIGDILKIGNDTFSDREEALEWLGGQTPI